MLDNVSSTSICSCLTEVVGVVTPTLAMSWRGPPLQAQPHGATDLDAVYKGQSCVLNTPSDRSLVADRPHLVYEGLSEVHLNAF